MHRYRGPIGIFYEYRGNPCGISLHLLIEYRYYFGSVKAIARPGKKWSQQRTFHHDYEKCKKLSFLPLTFFHR
jgi:hypothetical protein